MSFTCHSKIQHVSAISGIQSDLSKDQETFDFGMMKPCQSATRILRGEVLTIAASKKGEKQARAVKANYLQVRLIEQLERTSKDRSPQMHSIFFLIN